MARNRIELRRDGDRIAVWIHGGINSVWLDELLTAAADDPALAEPLESAMAEASARLRTTRERAAAKVVSLAGVKTTDEPTT
jgi:hypothetical protein